MKKLINLAKSNIVFILAAIIVFSVVLWGMLSAESMTVMTTSLMDQISENLGWFYVLSTALFVGFCFYLGFGPYRHMKLGRKDEKPEYSYFTWIGMLFAAGMGVGLVFWGIGEPLSHFANPPGDIEEGTQEAAESGLLWSIFHWGFHPWAIYAVVALGLAFAKYRKNLPGLISSSFYPLIGENIHKWPGKMVDIIAIVATTVGIATSFGLSTLQFGSGLTEIFGLPNNAVVQMAIIVVVTIIFLLSVVSGLNKGMKYLSVSNLGLGAILLLTIIIIGPTVFIFEHFSKTLGNYTSSFINLSFNTTPYSGNEWMGEWTLFYWAWIISWSPFVGTFIARVSKGRTLGEFILGVLFVPTLVTALWFVAFGGTGLHMEMNENANFASDIYETPEVGLFLVLEQLPGGFILNLASLVLIGIFFITSANSATYVLGVFSSSGDLNPKNTVLVVWGLLISSIASVLLLSGGLDGMQAISTITALPFSIIMILMMLAIVRSLKKEGKDKDKVKKEEDW
ncbi:glycine betaine transporter [Virgibacillus natechei]|uniref:Glycine betaine transporter n=1 Tax=Virgibacillus natechei TaxID=1216297 RepID=A0ABS4IJB3_9BACI|nr:BCCT family transporter [Virgibacillus natechei]MBP1970526.1 glycine betaine transporter [Virgibacillus natechei]UZD14071.1 BCCT family transporter [Virgibacillus natechei]